MEEILNKYILWKIQNPDTSYQYDEIHEFIAEIGRGDIYEVMEYLLKTFKNN
jgi:hypothetical protein